MSRLSLPAITITGEGFAPGAVVLFDGLAAPRVVVLATTTIAAVAPAHPEGAVEVVVTNPDGESTIAAGGYIYTAVSTAAPVVEAVSPSSGSTTGGTEMTLAGRGFAAGATVNLGAWPATNVIVLSDTSITAITPPHDAGIVDVTVINPDGQFGFLPGAYTYVADQPSTTPVVTITPSGVSPKELQVPVGSRVTFVNNDSRAHHIESDPHPIHTDCRAMASVGFIRPVRPEHVHPMPTGLREPGQARPSTSARCECDSTLSGPGLTSCCWGSATTGTRRRSFLDRQRSMRPIAGWSRRRRRPNRAAG